MSRDGEGDGLCRPQREDEPYRVGDKRPPKHIQFTPGQSGNPAGRPKGSVNLKQKFEKELGKTITVTKNGMPIRMTKADEQGHHAALANSPLMACCHT